MKARSTVLVTTIMAAAMSLAAIAADKNPIVGGKEMFPAKNIIENAVNSKDHTTLVAAVKAAGTAHDQHHSQATIAQGSLGPREGQPVIGGHKRVVGQAGLV